MKRKEIEFDAELLIESVQAFAAQIRERRGKALVRRARKLGPARKARSAKKRSVGA